MQVAHTSTDMAWKQVYQDALFEQDPKGLLAKLGVAKKVVDERLHEVLSNGATNRRELMELENAKRTILYLTRHEQQA